MTDYVLSARAAFADLSCDAAQNPGIAVSDRDGIALASVLVRKAQSAAFNARVRDCFGIELPRGPRRATAGGVAFIRIAPDAWLATSEEGGDGFISFLKENLIGLAAVSDQSSGYALLRLSGPRLRETLAKILPLDLHERAFMPGDAASTSASHVGATLWRLDDGADGLPVFEIAVFRSFAGSFWHSLTVSAAEFGLVKLESGSQ